MSKADARSERMRTLAACGACRRKPIDKTATSTTGGGKAKSHGHAKWPAGLFVPGELALNERNLLSDFGGRLKEARSQEREGSVRAAYC